MKKVFTLAGVFLGLCATAQTPQTFNIEGSLQHITLPVEKVYLSYPANGQYVNDSALVKDGTYRFSGKLEEPALAALRVKYLPDAEGKPQKMSRTRDQFSVFLSAGTATAVSVDSFSNATVKGLPTHDAFKNLQELRKPYDEKTKVLSEAYTKARLAKDEASMKALEEQFDELDNQLKTNVYAPYIQKNPSSPIALYVVSQYAGWDIDPAAVEPLFKTLPAATRQLASAKSLEERIEIAKKTAVGRMAIDFVQNDTLGNPLALSSLKGRYLLVDFWASWCGPCRAENPNVVKAYHAYKDKGFHILGVSLDQPGAKERWMKAIHDDNLTWTHVSDLKFWDNAVAKSYGIRAIPQNLLLDPTGKIIAKNLSGDKLVKKLAELMP